MSRPTKISPIKDRCVAIAVHPVFAAGITAMGVLAGFFGAVYGDSIKKELPTFSDDVVVPIFWGIVAVFSIGFAATPWAQAKLSDASQNELKSQSDALLEGAKNLEHAVKTLPPKGFLSHFSSLYDQAFQAYLTTANEPTADVTAYEHAIRVVLDAVAALAFFFDGNPASVSISANIMLAHTARDLSIEECERLKGNMKFMEPGVDVRKLLAVLELQPNLSVNTSNSGEATPDVNLNTIALPVPETLIANVGGRSLYNALPGAPYSYATGQPSGYKNTLTLFNWAENNGNYTPSIKQELKTYFGEGTEILSFLSVPLKAQDPPLGILNLHSNIEGMLGADGLKLFVPLLGPYVCLLCMLLERRQALLKKAP